MIGYFDTSAFVPLLLIEKTTFACRRFWDEADDVTSSQITYVETAAALAQAKRVDRLTLAQHRLCLDKLDELWIEVDVVEVDDALVRRAAELADVCALRGFDAVHCASAEQIAETDVVAATGDRRLIEAWRKLGVATFDPNRPG